MWLWYLPNSFSGISFSWRKVRVYCSHMKLRRIQLIVAALLFLMPFSFVGLPEGLKIMFFMGAGIFFFVVAWKHRNEDY